MFGQQSDQNDQPKTSQPAKLLGRCKNGVQATSTTRLQHNKKNKNNRLGGGWAVALCLTHTRARVRAYIE